MNNQNLKPFNTYDKDELRAICRKGGINSGISRKLKRLKIEEEKIKDIASIEALIDWSNTMIKLYGEYLE